MTSPAHDYWQIQDAKQRFSEMIRAVAQDGPQIITRHGEEVAVVVDIAEYRRLTRPSVGLRPTIPQALAGQTMLPSVSVPTVTAARPAAAATPDPELEPDGFRSSAYGLRVWPPRLLQPLLE